MIHITRIFTFQFLTILSVCLPTFKLFFHKFNSFVEMLLSDEGI